MRCSISFFGMPEIQYVVYTCSTSQMDPATFQILSNNVWLVATQLNNTGLDFS